MNFILFFLFLYSTSLKHLLYISLDKVAKTQLFIQIIVSLLLLSILYKASTSIISPLTFLINSTYE